jgi:hypothetical protein
MTYLSEVQENLMTKKYEDYKENKFKYIASFVQEFTNNKVLYVDEKKNLIKDDLMMNKLGKIVSKKKSIEESAFDRFTKCGVNNPK